jgi:hypothetical protein
MTSTPEILKGGGLLHPGAALLKGPAPAAQPGRETVRTMARGDQQHRPTPVSPCADGASVVRPSLAEPLGLRLVDPLGKEDRQHRLIAGCSSSVRCLRHP